MVISAAIFEVSRLSLFSSLTMIMQICKLILSGIDELMQITTGSELDMVGSRLWDFEGWYRSIGIVIAAVIFAISRLSHFSSLTTVMHIRKLDSVRDW